MHSLNLMEVRSSTRPLEYNNLEFCPSLLGIASALYFLIFGHTLTKEGSGSGNSSHPQILQINIMDLN